MGDDHILGGGRNDVLVAGDGDNFLFGGAGNDKSFGGSGNDIMEGGSDADQFNCENGTDTVLDYEVVLGDINASNSKIVNT
jgi:Ca2+-binding RTX toxin-like protein